MIEIFTGECCYIWEAIGDSDINEFKGGTYTLGYFHTQEEAKEAVIASGTYWDPKYTKAVEAIRQNCGKDGFTYYLVKQIPLEDNNTIKKRALAKLTLAEKKVLGLE